jgi:hypothetical protein
MEWIIVHELHLLGLICLDGLMKLALGPYPGSASDQSLHNLEDVEAQLDILFDAVMQYYGNGL